MQALTRLFDVREGERVAALQGFVTIFLLVAGHTVLETARDTLFLQRLDPSRLTLVYVVIAALTFAASPLSAALARRFGRRNSLVATLLAAAYGTALFHTQALTASSVFALYAWSGLLGTVLVIQFWLFASELLTVAQGKRLFGPIAAGGALGAVVGAAAALAVLRWLAVGSLLLMAAAIFLAASIVLTTVRSEEVSPRAAAGTRLQQNTRATLELLREQPYVVRLAGLAVLAAAALLTTDYLFKVAAARHVAPAELGSFFASYYAVLNGVSLVMQLFVAGPLIRRIGVVPSLALLPALLLLGGAATAIAGASLLFVLLLKSSDGAFRHSIHRVTSEIVEMPLPAAIHERTKAFVAGPLPRLAQALTAGLLLLLSSAGAQSERLLAALAATFSAGWFAVALGLRKPYLQRFREALTKPGYNHDALIGELDVDAVEAVLEALSSDEPRRVIGAMELLADKKRGRLIPSLVLYHHDESVLTRALEILSDSGRDDWLPHGERLLGHSSESVRAAALRALSRRGRHAALERGLLDESPRVRALAAFWLSTTENVSEPLLDPRIASLLELDGDAGIAAQTALLGAICDAPDVRWTGVLFRASETDDARVFEQVALAMTAIKDERFVPILIPRLEMRDGRGAVRDALVALGEPALVALEHALGEPATPERVRIHIPRTISRFLSQRAADVLVEQLDKPGQPGLVRYKVLRGLGRLVAESRVKIDPARIDQQIRKNLLEYLRVLALRLPLERRDVTPLAERSLRLVLGLLDAKLEQSLERAFRLLQIRHRNEDLRGVHLALSSQDRRTRSHALEFLDVLTSTHVADAVGKNVRELILIVADDLPASERLVRAARFLPEPPQSYAETLRALIADGDESLATFAAYHALEAGSSELEREVVLAMQKRPGLSRATGKVSLFPGPLEVQHAT